jgi:hypothetical protein
MERRCISLAVEAAAALLVATVITDALGYPNASFHLLVAGVPVTAAAGLVCLGRAVDEAEQRAAARGGRVQSLLLGLLVVAIVLGAAAREPALREGSVPVSATVALALGLVLLAVQAAIALAPFRR